MRVFARWCGVSLPAITLTGTAAGPSDQPAAEPAQLTDYHAKYFAHELTKRDLINYYVEHCAEALLDVAKLAP